MAYVAPSTVVAGQTYSAAAHNVIVNDVIDHETRINQYAGVYTNEAARDAAITSPTEGMRVYLTAPTVPAATGEYQYIATGATTIYNGTNWVCVTPVGALTSNAGTTTSGTYTATLAGTPGTNPSVTLVTGTTALISIRSYMDNTAAGNSNVVSVAVSGAGTVAANDIWALVWGKATNATLGAGTTFILGGLTAGTNTFTLNYRTTAGTASFLNRGITVQGIA